MSQANSFQFSGAHRLWQRPWIGPLIIAAAAVAMLVRTWQTWPDCLVDFGVQLYVPWQLAEGKVLYRDVAHYTGPLSVYYNALAFRVFGVNLRVLELANFPILIGTIWAVYFLGRHLGGKLCATVCGLSFVTLFAFAHITRAGNYNYVCPYEYDYTHAMFLCLLCIILLGRFARTQRLDNSAVAGFLAGLVFLTRSEFFLALIAAAAAALGLSATENDKRVRIIVRGCLMFFPAAAVAPIVSISILHCAMPLETAVRGTLGMWPALFHGGVTSQHFYQHSMGVDDLHKSLILLAEWVAAYGTFIGVFAACATLIKSRIPLPSVIAAFLIGAILIGWHFANRDWLSFFRPLPLIALLVIAISGAKLWRSNRNAADRPHAVLALTLGVFSFVLLGKIILYARIAHYGCWLAMPATMILIIALFGWIPSWISRRGGSSALFLSGIGGAWLAALAVYLTLTNDAVKTLTVPVGSGADQFWADVPRAVPLNNAILAAEKFVPAGKTLACFPEGIVINYLSRRVTATRFVNFNPPDLLLFGQEKMLGALEANPPDYIFIVHKDTSEFGEKYFGRDYGQEIGAWIHAHYQGEDLPMLDLGAQPLEDRGFGIRLMVPRPPPSPRRLIYGPPGPRIADSSAADSISSRE